MDDAQTKSPAPARLALLLAVAWLGFWALMKLYKGSPNDLPPQVTELSPWSVYTTFRGVVAIELAVVALALLWPRLGWFVVSAQYAVFLGILIKLIQAGAETCGCTGSVVSLSPTAMACIDGAILIGLLLSKPWQRLPRTKLLPLRLIVLVPLLGLAVWAPWTKFVPVELPIILADPDEPAGAQGQTTAAIEGDFYFFKPEAWEAQMIFDVDLARFLPAGKVDEFPDTALVVIYRKTCEHCAEHIAELAQNPPADKPIVLLRVPEVDDATRTDVIELRPLGAIEMELVPLARGYGIPTPMSFEIDNFMICKIQDHTKDDK